MTVSEILSSGQPVQVDLLTALPEGNDAATWPLCSWQGYQTQTVTPETQYSSTDGYVGEVRADFDIPLGQQQNILAFGISYQGIGIAVGQVNSPLAALGVVGHFRARINCYPWAAP